MAASVWGVEHGTVSKSYLGGGRFASITQDAKALKGARAAVRRAKSYSTDTFKVKPDFGYTKGTPSYGASVDMANHLRPTKIKKSAPDGMDLTVRGGKKGKKAKICLKPVSVTGQ